METKPTPRKFSTKGFTSLLLACSFLVSGTSGAILYLTPRGRTANWTNWTLFGLGKEQWAALHTNIAILFLIAAGLHVVLNWTMFWGYIKKKAGAGLNLKRELALAVVIAVLFVAGTLYHLPPFSTINAWNDQIKNYWDRKAAQAPVPHSEELTLAEFAAEVGLSVEDASEALRKEGFDVRDTSLTMAQLAESKGVAPSDVFAAIQEHFPTAGRGPGQGLEAGRGLGLGPRDGQGFGRQGGFGQGRGRGRGAGRGETGDTADGRPEGRRDGSNQPINAIGRD